MLQVTVGLGFPLTEQLNVAVSFSVTVRVAGDTVTSGAEIDSPGSPFRPAIPLGPALPVYCKLCSKIKRKRQFRII